MAAQLKYNGQTNLTSFYYNCCGRVRPDVAAVLLLLLLLPLMLLPF